MAADTGAAPSQAEDAAQPQAGATQTAQAASVEPDAVDTTETISIEEARKLRRESAALRKRVEELDRAAMSEQERYQRDRQELDRERAAFATERQDFQLRQAVASAATALGFIDPDDAYVHLDRSAIEWTDDGRPRGVERNLRAILERKPHLLNPNRTAVPRTGVQPSGRVGGGGDMNNLIRQAAGRDR